MISLLSKYQKKLYISNSMKWITTTTVKMNCESGDKAVATPYIVLITGTTPFSR